MCAWPPRRARPPARPGGNGQGASILSFLGIDRSHECNKERQRPFARLAGLTFARAQKHTRTKHQLQCGSRQQQQQQCKASPSRHFPRISPRPAPFPPRASRASRESAVSGRRWPATVATHKNGGEGSTLQTIHLQYIGGRAMHGYIWGLAGDIWFL